MTHLVNFFLIILLNTNLIILIKCNFVHAKKYDEAKAKLLHFLSYESYFANAGRCIPKLMNCFKSYELYMSKVVRCDNHKSKCSFYILVSKAEKNIIIVFSGTLSDRQFFHQLFSVYSKRIYYYKSGFVNKYYVQSFEHLWPYVSRIFKDKRFYDYTVYVTGHSLGSVYASLTAFKIHVAKYKDSSKIILYTFGGPRIGSLEFAKNFDKRIKNSYRVVAGTDFVPHFPACKKMKLKNSKFYHKLYKKKISLPCDPNDLNGYYHHGTEIWYPYGTEVFYIECKGYPKNEDFNCSDGQVFPYHKFSKHRESHSLYFKPLVNKFMKIFYYKSDENCEVIEDPNYRRVDLSE
uniref:Lipase_3 domain-containing protein n=2 Tax=Strongyloides stercoralis TaxID=6248 RepID=A0A0K0E7A2_STRER